VIVSATKARVASVGTVRGRKSLSRKNRVTAFGTLMAMG
jgi:hypothetical protein